ncbi:MAG: hypothetical protein GY804_08965 [Alphaproteobacteria bacterium]|nr:hypothetical protein [Alphaproteobacteria bacterium]
MNFKSIIKKWILDRCPIMLHRKTGDIYFQLSEDGNNQTNENVDQIGSIYVSRKHMSYWRAWLIKKLLGDRMVFFRELEEFKEKFFDRKNDQTIFIETCIEYKTYVHKNKDILLVIFPDHLYIKPLYLDKSLSQNKRQEEISEYIHTNIALLNDVKKIRSVPALGMEWTLEKTVSYGIYIIFIKSRLEEIAPNRTFILP